MSLVNYCFFKTLGYNGAKLLESPTKSGNKGDVGFRKRKMQNKEQEKNKNKDSSGNDIVDKLDMLIEQYRNKFSQKSPGNGGEKKPPKPLRKWFQI